MKRLGIVAALLGVATLALSARAHAAGGTTVVVTPANMAGWTVITDQTSGAVPSTASFQFVLGPTTPPLGTGSAEFRVGTNGDSAAQLRNPSYAGVKLTDLTTLSYSTYVSHNIDGQAPYLTLVVDWNNDGVADDALFFEPIYQNGGYGKVNATDVIPNQCGANPLCVSPNTWQPWDALNGGWWSNNDGGGPPLWTLKSYAIAHPGSTIVNVSNVRGGVRITAGFGAGAWDNFVGNADAFTIGVHGANTTYNFELQSVPTDKNQCKDGGWQTFNPPGGKFKNQGDCVSYVATRGGNGPGGH